MSYFDNALSDENITYNPIVYIVYVSFILEAPFRAASVWEGGYI